MTDLLEQRKALHQRIKDIEEQYQALEDALMRLQPLADLGMAWAMTAHELNNLLVPLMNYALLAMQNPEDRELCDKAIQKAARLSERATAILDKVMILADVRQMKKEKHALKKLVDNVFDCIARDPQKDGIRVIRRIDEDIVITADGAAIQHVFLNLILNACHAMQEQGGVLTISARQTADGTHIQISDTGCGIEPDMLKAIFTPFYTEGKDGGNGLGLAFCRKVIEAHDGFITVDSEPGRGTRFKILLPKYAL